MDFTMLSSISTITEYQCSAVINRYKKDYPNNTLQAEDALRELVKYFWISQKHQLDLKQFPDKEELKFICGMHPEMTEIDDMWHTFLLFTKEYMAFGKKYFDIYLHHVPKPENEEYSVEEFKIEFERYLSYIYDHLGEETVRKWFSPLLVKK
jgi:hypothetical protein